MNHLLRERRGKTQPGIEPEPTVKHRADVAIRDAVPWIFMAICVILLSAPTGLPGGPELMFGVSVGTVYFWSAHRPESMPSWAVFCIGLLADLLSFGPPGTLLLSLLIVHGVAHTWRYGLRRINFIWGWGLMSVLALSLTLFQWVVACIGALRPMSPVPSLFQAALAAGIYPTLSALFVWAHRTIVNPERA